MRFSIAVAAAGLAAGVAAQNATASDVWVTEVVTAYTTYCPAATEVSIGGTTYTVSEATTLTITDCPCTVTKPSTWSASWSTAAASTPVAPYPVSNGTVTSAYSSGAAAPTGASATTSSTTVPTFTGAASKAYAAGAGVFAIFGLVAAL